MTKESLTASWKLLVLRGLIGIVFGIIGDGLAATDHRRRRGALGGVALVDGIGLAANAFTEGLGRGRRMLLLGMAAVALVVAFLAFRPGMAAAWVLGIWLLVRGVFELVGALGTVQVAPRWLLVLGALRPSRSAGSSSPTRGGPSSASSGCSDSSPSPGVSSSSCSG